MINIAVMGYGTVGSGVVEVVNTNGARINQRIGDELNIKYVLDLKDFREIRYRKRSSMISRRSFRTMMYRSLSRLWAGSSRHIHL